jgi:ADP-ribosyl-[dinitrogen reductase] hydrolase
VPDGARRLDLDQALSEASGMLEPGKVSLPAAWTADLGRLRIAGVEPLVATAHAPPGSSAQTARIAALEADALTGGTLDAIALGFEGDAGRTLRRRGPAPPAPSAPHDPARLDRTRGALLGLAVGDCLGAPVENWPAEKIARVHGRFRDYVSGRGWGIGQPTRETTFALLVLREIAEGRSVHRAEDRSRLGEIFLRWSQGRPRDFGHLTRGILRSFAHGPPVVMARAAWERGDRALDFNAGLSRAAALGVALADDQDLRWTSALAASAMTHVGTTSLACAVAIAEGAAAAVRGEDPLAAAARSAWEDRCAHALQEVERGWEPGGGDWCGHERGHPLKSLKAAFWAVRRGGGLEETLLDLVHRGGDADTHACLAGCLLGALEGAGSIPARWLEPLETRPLLENLAQKIATRAA